MPDEQGRVVQQCTMRKPQMGEIPPGQRASTATAGCTQCSAVLCNAVLCSETKDNAVQCWSPSSPCGNSSKIQDQDITRMFTFFHPLLTTTIVTIRATAILKEWLFLSSYQCSHRVSSLLKQLYSIKYGMSTFARFHQFSFKSKIIYCQPRWDIYPRSQNID